MSDQRKGGIAWTDQTWNPLRGCTRVSEGCRNCYAEKVAHRFSGPGKPYEGLTTERGRWNGKIRLVHDHLDDPLRWRRPRMIFVNSMSDLFHPEVPFEYIAAVFGVMAATPHHCYQILTKRPERMLEWFKWMGVRHTGHLFMSASFHGVDTGPLDGIRWPLPNVHLGVSAENQEAADKRVPILLECPAAVRWVSAEPLLSPLQLDVLRLDGFASLDSLTGVASYAGRGTSPGHESQRYPHGLDWVVAGSESGHGGRPAQWDWFRSLKDQCVAAGVPYFFKQWVADGRKVPTPELDGQKWVQMPEVLQ